MKAEIKLDIRNLINEAAQQIITEEDVKKGLSQHADQYADVIASLIKAPKGDVKKVVDDLAKNVANPDKADTSPIEKELKDLEEAIGTGTAIAIASLIPKVLELTGDGADLLRRYVPGLKNENWRKEAKAAHDKVDAVKKEFKEAKKNVKGYRRMMDSPAATRRIKQDPKYKEAVTHLKNLREKHAKAEHDYDHKYGAKVFGKTLAEWGHKLHEAYVSPIKGLLWTLGWIGLWPAMRDEKKRALTANIIYSLSMVGLAGWGVWSHLAHAHGLAAYTTIATEIADGHVSAAAGVESALELAATT